MSLLATEQFNAAVVEMLDHLDTAFLPAGSTLALVEAAEKPVGVGAFAGNVVRGPLAVLGVRGGRVEARVRFDLHAATAAGAAAAALKLQLDARAAREDASNSWIRDFVVLEPAGGEPATLAAAGDWRQSVEYRVLYEYRYDDPEDAGGMIVRIDVALRGEQHEDAAVTRDLTRWSSVEAPPLRIRGPRAIGTLTALSLADPGGFPPGKVTLRLMREGGGLPVTTHPTLAVFAQAVVELGSRSDQVEFAGVTEFLLAFRRDGDDVMLADIEGKGVAYKASALLGPVVVPPPPPTPTARLAEVRLSGREEALEVVYGSPAGVDPPARFPDGNTSVVYLRAGRGSPA